MSTYGLRTYDSSGNILVDVDSKLNRVRYITVAAVGDSGSVTLDDLTGKTTAILAMPRNASFPWDAVYYHQHSVTRSGNTISWASDSNVKYDTLIMVFIYV
jgi:hypothetical protein